MPFKSFEEIMEFAIAKEIEAARFYDDAARSEASAGARNTFASFAAEERKHQNMLENFSRDRVADYRLEKVPNLRRSEYQIEFAYEPGLAYPDLLRLAVKREEKAQRFYDEFGRFSTLPEIQKLFAVLAQEEAKHKLRLETLLDDFMAKQGD